LQSDTTRASNIEWKIQSRVTSELEKLSSNESSKLKSLTQSIASGESSDTSSRPRFLQYVPIYGEKIAQEEKKEALSHESVSKEIEDLKAKMGKRKKLEQVDGAVEKARSELVDCLRTHDRRPLDCWKEREAFKKEVGRLEKEFVEKTIR
jgi:altered-inheritance-of-mitochondria protein 13